MKKKHLEIMLQKIPPALQPNPMLEQYSTPASIAADILYIAYQFGDIYDKSIIDLGCGTGIFAIGSALLGAKKIIGIDIDDKVIQAAKENAKSFNLKIEFLTHSIENVQQKCDTVLMNPPFGAQKSNEKADRKFIEKGFEIADILYSLHLTKTIPFLEKMISSLNGTCTFQKKYRFPIKWQFSFHSKQQKEFEVTLIRIQI
ncbi:MAG: METTL5 family protein [Thermoplasmatota archaeon]